MHNQWVTFSSEKFANTKTALSVFKSKLGEVGIQFYIQFNLKEKILLSFCLPNPTDDFFR